MKNGAANVRFVPEADTSNCNLLQYHHEAIFFCYSHGRGKTLILPNDKTLTPRTDNLT